jgi:hypothetical protein
MERRNEEKPRKRHRKMNMTLTMSKDTDVYHENTCKWLKQMQNEKKKYILL